MKELDLKYDGEQCLTPLLQPDTFMLQKRSVAGSADIEIKPVQTGNDARTTTFPDICDWSEIALEQLGLH